MPAEPGARVPAARRRSWLKRVLPRSLFGRLALIVVATLTLLLALTTLLFYERHWDLVTRRLALGLAGDVAVIMRAIETLPAAEADTVIRLARFYMEIEATFEPGAVLAPPQATPPRFSLTYQRIRGALRERLPTLDFRVDVRRTDERIRIDLQLQSGVLVALTPAKRVFSSSTYVFILWMIGVAVMLLAIAMVFLRNQMRPVRRLADAAERFGRAREVVPLKPEGASEIRRATTAFIAMRERIQRQIEQRTGMLAAVSHDLRTPLTRMRLEVAMLGDEPALEPLRTDIADMERIIKTYLDFARGEGIEPLLPGDLVELLAEVATEGRRHGVPVTLTTPPEGLAIAMRRSALKRCLTNLVDNAGRFGKRVEIAARRNDGLVEITIDDDGPGVPAEKREELFNAFHRLDVSRNPETGGVGLGLTIARDLARGHGGDIRLLPSPLGGLRAELRLPI
ncbi:MAG: HAMP domain-containing protein [Alphaproteobacteria bacterium]|nr:HAMP domain-containing protein [Alphaproteobacteria bacterium]